MLNIVSLKRKKKYIGTEQLETDQLFSSMCTKKGQEDNVGVSVLIVGDMDVVIWNNLFTPELITDPFCI